MRLYGKRWHLATDALPLLGIVLLILAIVVLAVFLAFLLSSTRPKDCANREQYAVSSTWVLPGLRAEGGATCTRDRRHWRPTRNKCCSHAGVVCTRPN